MKMFLRAVLLALVELRAIDALAFHGRRNSSVSANTSGLKKLVRANRTSLPANKSGARKFVAANRTSLLVSKPAASSQDVEVVVPLPTHETAPLLVVEVPVVEVVMVDNSSAQTKMSQQTSSSDVSAQCQSELEGLSASRSRVQRAETCEQQNKLSEQAVTALQQGNQSRATDAIERGFFECGALSMKCSEELAPEVVLKLRLTGVTVTKQCIQKAQAMQGKKATKADQVCQDNVTKSMISQLSQRNLNGAMSAAEYGLKTCQDIQRPCDFQLAPVLVTSLLEQHMEDEEEAQQQEIVEVMLTGIAAAQEMSKKLQQSSGKVNATQRASQKHQTAKKPVLATPLKNKKAISLLSIAQHVRIGVTMGKFTH